MQLHNTTMTGVPNSAELHAAAHVVIVGVGLIGGSIAAALRKRHPGCRITGLGRSAERLKQAVAADLLDDYVTSASELRCLPGCLAIVCLPVDHIATAVRQLAMLDATDLLVTDAGSVKSLIYRELGDFPAASGHFVGSHPIAGSEQTGFEFAQPDLFVDRMCIVTPESAAVDKVARVQRFWESLGSRVRLMTADEHDRILSLTSHLPHVLASVAAGCITREMLPFIGTGFRDTTRIAAGSAELWTQILCGNGPHMIEAIQAAELGLSRIRQALAANDRTALEQILAAASHFRQQLAGDKPPIGNQ